MNGVSVWLSHGQMLIVLAEISWVAVQLKRCLEMLPTDMIQIDIFVTNTTSPPTSATKDTFFAPPKPRFAMGSDGSRRGSLDSIASQLSVDSHSEHDNSRMEVGSAEGGSDLDTSYVDIVDLTNFEDEEDVQDEAERKLSSQVAKEGKVRRARSRKAARGSVAQPPLSPRRPSDLRLDSSSSSDHTHVDNRISQHQSAYGSEIQAPRTQSAYNLTPGYINPFAGGALRENRQSYRSIAESSYGRYDPYGERGMRDSPSPSMFFDDSVSVTGDSVRGLMNRASQTQSMIMLDGAAPEDMTDPTVWINQADFIAMSSMAEHARSGKPKLAQVFEEELELAKGSIMVASMFPAVLWCNVDNPRLWPGSAQHSCA